MSKSLSVKELLASRELPALMEEVTFEQGIKLLDELVGSVESGSLALNDSMRTYEVGVQLSERLRSMLDGAEQKLKLLRKTRDGIVVEDPEATPTRASARKRPE